MMSGILAESERCYCGEERGDILCIAWDRLRGCDGEFRIKRCMACATVYTVPRLSGEELRPYYAANTCEEDTRAIDSAGAPTTAPGLFPFLRRWVRPESHPLALTPPGRVLDVGCGHGELLDALAAVGWETWGIETDARAAAQVSRRGHRIKTTELTAAEFEDVRFDMIWMSHSLEHFHDPLEACRAARAVLKPGGHLLVRVPRIDGLLPRLALQDWYNLDAPRHLWHFSSATLARLLHAAGFRVLQSRSYSTWADYAATGGNWISRLRHGSGPSVRRPISGASAVVMKLLWALFLRPLDVPGFGDRLFVIATRTETGGTDDR
jgi:SAM-dependent methyltransferase